MGIASIYRRKRLQHGFVHLADVYRPMDGRCLRNPSTVSRRQSADLSPPPSTPPTKDQSSLGWFSVVNRCIAANISEKFQCLNVNRPTTNIVYRWSDYCRTMVGLLSDDGQGFLDEVPNYFKGRNRSATQKKIYTCNWPWWSHGWPTKKEVDISINSGWWTADCRPNYHINFAFKIRWPLVAFWKCD